ncbi:MAG: hypothetical protein ACOX8Q_01995 [Christensenellales bacterium]
MKERLSRTQLSVISGILTIIALFAGIILLAMVMYVLADALNITFVEYIEYVLFITISVMIIRNWITEYEYIVVDGDLFVDRYIGKRSKRIFSVSLSDITYIGKQPPKDCPRKKQRMTFKSKRRGVAYIVYNNSEKRCAYFSPSEKMLSFINERKQEKLKP